VTATHELIDHTSELTLRLRGPTFGALVAEAARAYAGLVPDGIERSPSAGERVIRLDGEDRVATLVEWLNELVYLAEVELWVPTEAEVEEAPDGALTIRARGEALAEPFVLVKAATLHGARVREGPDGLEVEVTLDV